MEGGNDDTQVSGVYLSKGKHIKTYMAKLLLACRESREVVDDNTNHQGTRMVFLVMNSIRTWKSPRVMRTTTHYVGSLRGCHRIATTSRKGMARKRYSVFLVNDNPEPTDWQN